MNVAICLLQLVFICIVRTEILENVTKSKPYVDFNVDENARKISQIFKKTFTIHLLLKSYEQPEGILDTLENIFGGNGNKAFVVFNFITSSQRRDWINECGDYLSVPDNKVVYYERLYQKLYGDTNPSKGLRFEEEFRPERDPQAAVLTSVTSVQVQEEFARKLDDWRIFQNTGYIIFTSIHALEYYVGCIFNRGGTFLFIIDDVRNNEDHMDKINETFSNAWNRVNNLRMYILVNQEIFTFNPFKKVNGKFGVTEKFDEENILIEENLKDLNGYPLRIEMFWSVFSVPKDGRSSQNLSLYHGPDVTVAKMLTERMNLTSKLALNL